MADLWLRPQCRHRRRAGARHDARADQREALRQRFRRRAGATASTSWPSAQPNSPPAAPSAITGVPAGPDRRRGADLRRWPVDLRQRPRHRRLQRRCADLPRLPLPGGDQRQRRPARRQPARAHAEGLPQLPRSAARCRSSASTQETESRTHWRRPLSAVGGPKGLADGLPQPLRDRSHADRQALPGARTLCERGQHSRHLSEHAAHHRGAAVAGFRGGRRATP